MDRSEAHLLTDSVTRIRRFDSRLVGDHQPHRRKSTPLASLLHSHELSLAFAPGADLEAGLILQGDINESSVAVCDMSTEVNNLAATGESSDVTGVCTGLVDHDGSTLPRAGAMLKEDDALAAHSDASLLKVPASTDTDGEEPCLSHPNGHASSTADTSPGVIVVAHPANESPPVQRAKLSHTTSRGAMSKLKRLISGDSADDHEQDEMATAWKVTSTSTELPDWTAVLGHLQREKKRALARTEEHYMNPSLYCLESDSSVREKFIRITEWPTFNHAILVLILVNCVTLLLGDPVCQCSGNPDDTGEASEYRVFVRWAIGAVLSQSVKVSSTVS